MKRIALDQGLPLYQPDRFNTEKTWEVLRETAPDLSVVVAYSAKIGRKALDLVPEGWLNLHPSLLPKYRGAAPLQWAIMNGETETGITTFFLNEEWDAGPICYQEPLSIGAEETYGELSDRCARLGADLVIRSVQAIAQGTAPRIPQEEEKATFARLLSGSDCIIDWKARAEEVHNKVRGLSPVPGAITYWKGTRLRVLTTRKAADGSHLSDGRPGEVVRSDRGGFFAMAGDGPVEVLRLQPANSRAMDALAFINGHSVKTGDLLEPNPGEEAM